MIRFNPGEFEKRYSAFEKYSHMILNIPFTAAAHAAIVVARQINETVGSQVLDLKEVTALSKKDTKLTFVISDYDFHVTKRNAFEKELRRALDEYFRKHPLPQDREAIEEGGSVRDKGIVRGETLAELEEAIAGMVKSVFG